jgi:hypothetical protein
MRCRAELHAAHRGLAHHVEARASVVAIDTLPAEQTPSGDVETELVLRADRVPAPVCRAVADAQLAIASVARQGPDHTVVRVR